MNTNTVAMPKKGTSKLEIIKKIHDYGLANEKTAITNIADAAGINNSSVKEYLDIMQFISENPVEIMLEEISRFTFITIKNKKD